MNNTPPKACTCCNSKNVREVISIPGVPTHCNILWKDRDSAVTCTKGDIQLTFCENCGHLYNQAFDSQLMSYSQTYENTLDFSPVFQDYSRKLAKRLISHYDLHEKDILEVGCGKGDFLKLICNLGGNRGYGFDKSYEPSMDHEQKTASVHFTQDFYHQKYHHYPADFIISRHVLEHIQNPVDFLNDIKTTAQNGKNQHYYLEVPNVLYTLRDLGIWDLIYEHCSYFSSASLTRLLDLVGFHIINTREEYMKQFLSIEASTNSTAGKYQPPGDSISEIATLVEKFATRFEQKVTSWKSKLEELKGRNKTVVVWGGGSKGVSFLNFLPTSGFIEYIVDINPRKNGMYVAGTGQRYINPKELAAIAPELVIVMNPLYKEEIFTTLEEMRLAPELLIA